MAIAQQLAGYSLGKADLLRRAMGKKKKEILDKEFIPFAEGMRANGYSDDSIKTLWDILVPFSDYAFNKAHTAGYGLVSYWTAYLKANYPAEYMSGLLTSIADDKDKSAIYLNECRWMDIKVLPPDVNESMSDFAPAGTDIRFGLSAIRNVGTNVVESIIRTRVSKGRFADFHDFIDKVEITRLQQARRRVADQGRRVRQLRAHPRGPAGDPRADHRRRAGHQAGRGRRAVRPVRRTRRQDGAAALVPGTRLEPSPPGVGQGDAAQGRADDARPVRQRPPAVRAGAGARRRWPTCRSPRCRPRSAPTARW